ncbi:MAG TPA: choice-of-anchor Q domain-containing protein [Polyangia bacterium]
MLTGFSVAGTCFVEVTGLRVTGPGGDKPGVFVSGLATLSLHAVKVDNAGSVAVSCQGSTLSMDRVEIVGSHLGGVDLNNCLYTITNSVIAKNGGQFGGVRITLPRAGSAFVNNTVVLNTAGGTTPGGVLCASAAQIVNSVIWGNSPTDVSTICSVTFSNVSQSISGQGNIMHDPTFVNSTTGDYRYQAGSWGIDSATPVGAPAFDFDGAPRPYGASPDMGAFEWHP